MRLKSYPVYPAYNSIRKNRDSIRRNKRKINRGSNMYPYRPAYNSIHKKTFSIRKKSLFYSQKSLFYSQIITQIRDAQKDSSNENITLNWHLRLKIYPVYPGKKRQRQKWRFASSSSLLQHFGRFGCPRSIRSDRGSHFANELIKEFLLAKILFYSPIIA